VRSNSCSERCLDEIEQLYKEIDDIYRCVWRTCRVYKWYNPNVDCEWVLEPFREIKEFFSEVRGDVVRSMIDAIDSLNVLLFGILSVKPTEELVEAYLDLVSCASKYEVLVERVFRKCCSVECFSEYANWLRRTVEEEGEFEEGE